jgi:hypothetical protein
MARARYWANRDFLVKKIIFFLKKPGIHEKMHEFMG